jgi:TrmH family RNA methyltransferase
MAPFRPESVRFVLVEPRYAGNAGAAARALKNLGFSRLVLVRPGFARDDAHATAMAVGACDVLTAAGLHEELTSALAGTTAVIGTTRRGGKHRKPHYRLDAFAPALARLASAGELAVVFGSEESGLNDRDLDLCTHLLEIPSDAACGSFNLSQAVLLVAWELRRADPWPEPLRHGEDPASHEDREAMYAHLGRALDAIGFLHDDTADGVLRRLRRLLGRASMTDLEVRLLRGVAHQMLWAAARAGLPAGKPASETAPEQNG